MKKSNNRPSKKRFRKGKKGISGENITSNPLGFDQLGAAPFGIGEFGGIVHFKNREDFTVDH